MAKATRQRRSAGYVESKAEAAVKAYKAGEPMRAIAQKAKISVGSLYRLLKDRNVRLRNGKPARAPSAPTVSAKPLQVPGAAKVLTKPVKVTTIDRLVEINGKLKAENDHLKRIVVDLVMAGHG